MHSLLRQILEKIGIKDFSELKTQERVVYEAWNAILLKDDVTLDDLKKILLGETERVRRELAPFENSGTKDLYLKAYMNLLDLITKIIVTPEKERAALQAELKRRFGL